MENDSRIKLNVFNEKTTYKNDYRIFAPDKREKHIWPKNRTEKLKSVPQQNAIKDPECFIQWKNRAQIPFNMLVKPRPIIDTSPMDIYDPKLLENPKDLGKNEAIKTRPRVYKAPAVSIDDIPDQKMRELIIAHMYTTDWKKAANEAAGQQRQLPKPSSTYEPVADLVTLKTNIFPVPPDGCRQQAKSWDVKQRRALVEPIKTFWLNKNPPVICGACENPYKGIVPQELKEEISELIKNDKLRMAHDYLVPGYAGYKPKLAVLPLKKVDLPVVHPFLSTSQAVTQRYIKE